MAEKKPVKKTTAAKAPAKKAAPKAKAEKKEMATIYIFGKKYDVPAELTIMNAMCSTEHSETEPTRSYFD